MEIENNNISIRKYADKLGISDRAVRKAIETGKIVKGVFYKQVLIKDKPVMVPEINEEMANDEWGYIHTLGKVRPGQDKLKVAEKSNGIFEMDQKNLSTQPLEEVNTNNAPVDTEEIEETELLTQLKITKDTSYQEASKIREIMGAILDKMKVQEQKRILVKKDDVEKSLFNIGTEIKKRLLNIPARITSQMRGAETQVEAEKLLTIELTEVLNEFAALAKIE